MSKNVTCSVSKIGRSSGRSATASAAYRAGEQVHDERTGLTHDYSRKSGVVHSQVLVPEHAPALSRSELWNAAEQAENRKNSVVAREVLVGLPHELPEAARTQLAIDLGQWLTEQYNVAADVCVHTPDTEGDKRNHHAHIMITTRELGPEGLGAKTRILDSVKTGPEQIEQIRAHYTAMGNEALRKHGFEPNLEHRSFERQELDVEPTIKMGPKATAMERKAKREAESSSQPYQPVTDLGQQNAEIRQRNQNVIDLFEAARQLEREIENQAALEAAAQEQENERLNRMLENERKRWIKQKLTPEQLQDRATQWRDNWRMETAAIAKANKAVKTLRARDSVWGITAAIDEAQERVERAEKQTGIGRKLLASVVPIAAPAELKAAREELGRLERERDALPEMIYKAEKRRNEVNKNASQWWEANTDLRNKLADKIDAELVPKAEETEKRKANSIMGQSIQRDLDKQHEADRAERAKYEREQLAKELKEAEDKLKKSKAEAGRTKGHDNSLSM